MSDLQGQPALLCCGGEYDAPQKAVVQTMPAKAIPHGSRIPGQAGLGTTSIVQRFLPAKERRMVGPWCFLDRFGPGDLADVTAPQAPAHPHLGLQSITWMLEGSLVHCDSLGNTRLIEPGGLGLLTSGSGVSHSEELPEPNPDRLHALQLWAVLPEDVRNQAPRFEYHPRVPSLKLPGLDACVMLGELGGVFSPAKAYSPLVAALVRVAPGAGGDSAAWLPLKVRHEHAVLLLSGSLTLNGDVVQDDHLCYLGKHRDGVDLVSPDGATFLLIGGEPFAEEVLLWWNLAARQQEELVSARTLWNAHSPRFGKVPGCVGAARAVAPPMPQRPVKPRPVEAVSPPGP